MHTTQTLTVGRGHGQEGGGPWVGAKGGVEVMGRGFPRRRSWSGVEQPWQGHGGPWSGEVVEVLVVEMSCIPLLTPPPGPDHLPPVTMWPIPWCIWHHPPPPVGHECVTHVCENIIFAVWPVTKRPLSHLLTSLLGRRAQVGGLVQDPARYPSKSTPWNDWKH